MTEKLASSKEIQYGNYVVLCALTKDEKLYIASSTIEKLLIYRTDSCREKITSKSFKAFVGKGFHVGKIIGNLSGIGRNAKTVFYPFDVFLKLAKWELTKDKATETRKAAINLVIAGFADSFSDFAFNELGKELTRQERQQWLMLRQSTKDTFHPLTAQLKAHGFTEPWEYGKYIHAFQQKLGIEDGTRDEQINAKLGELIQYQSIVATLMLTGISPWEALEKGFANYKK